MQREESNVSTYRGWGPDAFSQTDPGSSASSQHGGEVYGHRPYAPSDTYNSSGTTSSLDVYGQSYVPPSHAHGHASQSGHSHHPQHTHSQHAPFTAPNSPGANPLLQPRHTYTRTLVGPLSANACRLNDEHRKPGIFFLFQDLSIRTEGGYSCFMIAWQAWHDCFLLASEADNALLRSTGTFRLRLRLMNVGA
jgi:hypothetical protein